MRSIGRRPARRAGFVWPLAAAMLALLRPASAPGQGAPIPLLPPSIAPVPAPTTPTQAAPSTPYEAAPLPYAAVPATPYPAAPPPPQPAPIIATPLPPPNAPASGTTPGASTATVSAPAAPAAPATAAQIPPAPPQYPNAWVPETTARLLVLNKIDALREDLTVKVGQSASYGALTISVRSCLVRPPNQPADATAYLVISDSHKDEPGFSGWTLANEPWLSMLQNPIYDVWVVGCQP